MLDVIEEHLAKGGRGEEISIVFAGGIHDSLSAAMVSVLAAPLAQKGVKIGALMGTAYLFTQEAVAGGAIELVPPSTFEIRLPLATTSSTTVAAARSDLSSPA